MLLLTKHILRKKKSFYFENMALQAISIKMTKRVGSNNWGNILSVVAYNISYSTIVEKWLVVDLSYIDSRW